MQKAITTFQQCTELSVWLSEIAWAKLKALEEDMGPIHPLFSDLTERVTADAEEWEDWYNKSDPENYPMPGEYNSLAEMPRLMLMRILRPDRIPFALTEYVKKNLGSITISVCMYACMYW